MSAIYFDSNHMFTYIKGGLGKSWHSDDPHHSRQHHHEEPEDLSFTPWPEALEASYQQCPGISTSKRFIWLVTDWLHMLWNSSTWLIRVMLKRIWLMLE